MKLSTRKKPTKFLKTAHFNSRYMVTRDFQKNVNSLTYRQLIRINSVLSARNKVEKFEAAKLVHTLTPPERKIVTSVERFQSKYLINSSKKYIQKVLQHKNAEELKNINSKEVLKSLLEVKY